MPLRAAEASLERYDSLKGVLWMEGGLIIRTPGLIDIIMGSDNWRWMSIDIAECTAIFATLFSRRDPSIPLTTWTSVSCLHVTSKGKDHLIPYSVSKEDLPALVEVHLFIKRGLLHMWELPWSQLSILSIKDFTSPLDGYVKVMGLCTRLERCTIEVPTHVAGASPRVPLPCVINYSLKSLALQTGRYFPSRNIFSSFIDGLTLPNVKKLALRSLPPRGRIEIPPNVLPSLQSFLDRSQCCIDNLDIALSGMPIIRDVDSIVTALSYSVVNVLTS